MHRNLWHTTGSRPAVCILCCVLSLVAIASASGATADPGLTEPRIRTLLGGEYWQGPPTPDYVDYLAQVKRT